MNAESGDPAASLLFAGLLLAAALVVRPVPAPPPEVRGLAPAVLLLLLLLVVVEGPQGPLPRVRAVPIELVALVLVVAFAVVDLVARVLGPVVGGRLAQAAGQGLPVPLVGRLLRLPVRLLVGGGPAPTADGAAGDARGVIGLEGLLLGLAEHLVVANRRQPVGYGCREEVAGALAAALDERPGPEFLEAGAGGGERLAAARRARIAVLKNGMRFNLLASACPSALIKFKQDFERGK